MDDSARHELNQGTAAGKVVEGEAIVINAATGRYYSLDDAACVAWVHLSAGASVGETVAAILARYDAEAEAVRSDLVALIEALVAADLLVEAPGDMAPEAVDESEVPEPGSSLAYAPLELVTFSDMEDLLAFDPPLPVTEAHAWEWRAG